MDEKRKREEIGSWLGDKRFARAFAIVFVVLALVVSIGGLGVLYGARYQVPTITGLQSEVSGLQTDIAILTSDLRTTTNERDVYQNRAQFYRDYTYLASVQYFALYDDYIELRQSNEQLQRRNDRQSAMIMLYQRRLAEANYDLAMVPCWQREVVTVSQRLDALVPISDQVSVAVPIAGSTTYVPRYVPYYCPNVPADEKLQYHYRGGMYRPGYNH